MSLKIVLFSIKSIFILNIFYLLFFIDIINMN